MLHEKTTNARLRPLGPRLLRPKLCPETELPKERGFDTAVAAEGLIAVSPNRSITGFSLQIRDD